MNMDREEKEQEGGGGGVERKIGEGRVEREAKKERRRKD